jgi:small subunit ribosomal protein S15
MTTPNEAIATLRLHDKDTGGSTVQVCKLTERITHLTEHLKIHRKDHSTRLGLIKLVNQRRALLEYLNKNSTERYKQTIELLGLRR